MTKRMRGTSWTAVKMARCWGCAQRSYSSATDWLGTPISYHGSRIATARRDTRPLLKNGDPKGTLERLAIAERQAYAAANIHVKSGDGAHKDVVEAIVQRLEEHLSKRGAD